MRPLLTVQNLNLSLYNRPILREISFEIFPQQIFVLTGPDRTAKSTILRAICAHFSDNQNATINGQIIYQGNVIQPDNAPKLAIQNAGMLIGTVFENLSQQSPQKAIHTDSHRRQNIEEFLCKLGLEQLAEMLDTEVLDLTKLDRRKLLIANALLESPALICLDNPAADLDEKQADDLLEFIHSIAERHAVIMSTQNEHHAHVIGTVTCRIDNGQIQDFQHLNHVFDILQVPSSIPAPDYFDDVDSGEFLDELPEIPFSSIHDGPITEPDFGNLPSNRNRSDAETSFIGARPKTLTSNPIHSDSQNDIPQSRERVAKKDIPLDDVFAVIEDLYLNKSPKFLTTLKRHAPAHSSINISEARGPRGFRWLRRGVLAGTPQPGLLVDIKQDLTALKRVRVTHLITLTEEPLDNAPLQDFAIHNIHFPIVDMQAPDLEDTAKLCATVEELIATNATIAYHCQAGIGRTGTMLTAQLIWEGMDAHAALKLARNTYSKWVQSKVQEEFLTEFQHWIRPTP